MPQPVKRRVLELQSSQDLALQLCDFGTFGQQPAEFHLPGMASLGQPSPNQGRALDGAADRLGGSGKRLEWPFQPAGRPAGPARSWRAGFLRGGAAFETLIDPLLEAVAVIVRHLAVPNLLDDLLQPLLQP